MSNSTTLYDVIVIGGGASGMMAAGRAGERGKRVLLIEKNNVLGKKLSITGGGRCNITNAEFDVRTFAENFGKAREFLFSPLSQFGVQETFDFFESHGLPLIVEEKKRAFPKTQSAPDVTRVMEKYVKTNNVEILTGVAVRGLVSAAGRVLGVHTSMGEFRASAVVLATGGLSHAHTGSTGEGVAWADSLGHTVHDSNPDLVPLAVKEDWVKNMPGKSLDNAKITFVSGDGRFSKTGRILFTHFGLSGPTILNAAHRVKELLQSGPVHASIDLFPHLDEGALRSFILSEFEKHKNMTFKNILRTIVPSGMSAAALMHVDGALHEIKIHSISKESRNILAHTLKNLPCTIVGTMGFDRAVISDGGVDLSDVDMRTMSSRKLSNLYFIGDTLHIQRPTGGFSLQLCWTTGWVAGNSV